MRKAAFTTVLAIAAALAVGACGTTEKSGMPAAVPETVTIVTTDTAPAETVTVTETQPAPAKPKPAQAKPKPAQAVDESNETSDQRNARETATDYLAYSSFSRTGLIQQLKYEGFSKADAEYAVDSINVDWKQQAVKTAKDYLEYSSFSRSGLVEQLVYDGFTREQAEYGVQKAY